MIRFGAAGLALVLMLVTALQLSATHLGPGVEASGLYQGDLPENLCIAREATRSPTLLTYANPHDLRDPPRPVYVGLPLTALGWALKLIPSPPVLETAMRVVFGVAMFTMLGLLLAQIFEQPLWLWAAFALCATGGGFAWLEALATAPPGIAAIDHVARTEATHYWWALSLFRTLIYPLELLYHALLFAQLACLVRRRWGAAHALTLVAVLCNPFFGVQSVAIELVAVTAARGLDWRKRLPAYLIAAVFALYLLVVLPGDPVAASVSAQVRKEYADPLSLHDLVFGHGLALIGVAGLFHPAFRRWLRGRAFTLPLCALLGVTVLLTEGGRLPFFPRLQPLHFTRGYLAVGLWCLTVLWLRFLVTTGRLKLRRPAAALCGLVLLALPDTAAFLRDQYVMTPYFPMLTWPDTMRPTLEFLDALPGRRRVFTPSPVIGSLVCGWTRHQSVMGASAFTPDFDSRYAALLAFRRDSATAKGVGDTGADTLLVPSRDYVWLRALDGNKAWHRVRAASDFVIYSNVAGEAALKVPDVDKPRPPQYPARRK